MYYLMTQHMITPLDFMVFKRKATPGNIPSNKKHNCKQKAQSHKYSVSTRII